MSTRDIPTGALVFDLERQRFLSAFNAMLEDRTLPADARAEEALSTIKALQALMDLLDV